MYIQVSMHDQNIQPLTRETFNRFLETNRFSLNAINKENNEPVSDSVVLYNIVIHKLLEQGVQFSSPGNSPKRHFILWFNAQVDESQLYSRQIEIKEKYFDLICEIVSNLNNNK
jgi:hypothetical protein